MRNFLRAVGGAVMIMLLRGCGGGNDTDDPCQGVDCATGLSCQPHPMVDNVKVCQ